MMAENTEAGNSNGGSHVVLSDGSRMPRIALGTWRTEPAALATAIRAAISAGVRHFDCAALYFNESVIGEAIAAAITAGEVKREQLFICSKLMPTSFAPHDAIVALEKTLADLRVDYIDLYLIHWPYALPAKPSAFPVPPAERLGYSHDNLLATWRALEGAVDRGLVKSLGVSNCTPRHLEPLIRDAKHAPQVRRASRVYILISSLQWRTRAMCVGTVLGTVRLPLLTLHRTTSTMPRAVYAGEPGRDAPLPAAGAAARVVRGAQSRSHGILPTGVAAAPASISSRWGSCCTTTRGADYRSHCRGAPRGPGGRAIEVGAAARHRTAAEGDDAGPHHHECKRSRWRAPDAR